MNDKQKDFIVELVAGAVLLLLGLLVLSTKWSNSMKTLVVVVVVLGIVAVLLLAPLGARIRTRLREFSKPKPSPAPPTLAQQLDETWFVTFTSGPYVTGPDGREEYATAIAAVYGVDNDAVTLRWRDKGSFPTRVPIKLLEATQVVRFRGQGDNRRRVQVRNDGLRSHAPGGVVTGSGWRAHPESPHQIAYVRYDALDSAGKKSMEADANLDTYDLEEL